MATAEALLYGLKQSSDEERNVRVMDPLSIPTDRPLAIDFETAEEDSFRPDMLAIAWKADDGTYTTATYDFPTTEGMIQALFECLRRAKLIICHQLMMEMRVLARMGMDTRVIEHKVHDTMIMSAIQDSEQLKGLKPSVAREFGVIMTEWKEASKLSREEYRQYNREDAIWCLRLYEIYLPRMKSQGFETCYEMERRLAFVCLGMWETGILIDVNHFNRQKSAIEAKVNELIQQMAFMVGRVMNFNSTTQLKKLLFETWGLTPNPKHMTKGGKKGIPQPSVDYVAIESIGYHLDTPEHIRQFCVTYLSYSEYHKLLSSFLTPKFLGFVHPDGRIRAEAQPLAARTGRFSYKNPNLQQIPKDGFGTELRRMFIAPEGSKLICVDQSQVEYRLLAHFTGDKALIEAFHKGADFHQATADLIGGSRAHAKTVNFGVVYGMGVHKFAASTGKSLDEAREYLNAYYARFPGVLAFKRQTKEYARMTGGIRTMSGRFRSLKSYMGNEKGMMERLALNTVVQGGAADLIKIAMIEAERRFRGTPIKMILQVHDELTFECPDSLVREALPEIKDIMENTHKLSVPLVADPAYGRSWLDAKGK